MEGSDFLLAGVLFLFAAVAAVPLASRLGIGAVRPRSNVQPVWC